jgi:prepilin-type N-terminal cleavage/methylation domain-containing protein
MSRRPAKSSGFTIIEVVLVLAIAALIFLIVFLAIPTLQRSQRDNQRKQNLAQILGAIQKWEASNNGHVLDTQAEITNLENNFISNIFDPSTATPYVIVLVPVSSSHVTSVPASGSIVYNVGHICGSDTGTFTYTTESAVFTHNVKQFAVLLSLENGGAYCLDVE